MVTILFGAGADAPYGISCGKEFASTVVGLNAEEINNEIKSFYSAKQKRVTDGWYPPYVHETWDENKLLRAAIRKTLLDQPFDTKSDYESMVESEYNRAKGDIIKKIEHLTKHTSYMGLIDENMHTLINPRVLGAKKFWRIINAYTRAYVSIIGIMESKIRTVDYHKITSDYHYGIDVMSKFSKEYDGLESYYSILRNYPNAKIVTTNYTSLCEMLSKRSSGEVAYVHGKFGWFESARELVTYDVEVDKLPDDDILFPYISIQSGVKPVIDYRQIQEYAKMLRYFEKSDYIFILGYRLNSDDNHINSMLKTQLLNGKHLLYFSFEDESKEAILSRLRMSDSTKLEVLPINKANAYTVFDSELKKYDA